MSQLTNTQYFLYDTGSNITGTIDLIPKTNRNGITTLTGSESTADLLPANTNVTVTASVRPGKPFDPISLSNRIKRKLVLKVKVPLAIPGLVAGSAGTVIDYIDAELTVANPVEASDDMIQTAFSSFGLGGLIDRTPWIMDMIRDGREPY